MESGFYGASWVGRAAVALVLVAAIGFALYELGVFGR
jgi:hypothetical protein